MDLYLNIHAVDLMDSNTEAACTATKVFKDTLSEIERRCEIELISSRCHLQIFC